MTRVQSFLYAFGFARYDWFRRWVGGYWEPWLLNHPVCSHVWQQGQDVGQAHCNDNIRIANLVDSN